MLRIALTSDPELPVPPKLYGGIERIIDMLACGLVSRGHDVTVFAHPDSQTAGRLIKWPGRSSQSLFDTISNAALLQRVVKSEKFDVVHSFSRIAYLLPLLPKLIPKLMTYQREINKRSIKISNKLSGGTLWYSAISRQMMQDVSGIGTWRLVSNGVSLSAYRFRSNPGNDAPLVFLGRIERIKGPHIAIEVAKRVRLPIVLAGNIAAEHRDWFDSVIAPQIDGTSVRYIGPVNDAAKNELLGQARALLMPILWEEPFGIVMVEAMACGTPVIGYGRGAVPEVVEDGVTGFICSDVDNIVSATQRINSINRMECRARVERLFSEESVVENYLAVYHEMISRRVRGSA